MEQHRCSLNFRFLRRCEILAVTRNVETLCRFIIYPQSICPGEIQTDDSGSFIPRAQEFRAVGGDVGKAVELIQRNTRRYAKRQLSYWGRDKEINWIEL